MMTDTTTTQVVHPWRATIRTAFQILIALAVSWGAIVEAAGLDTTGPFVAGTLTVAAAITRLMALPAVESLLRQYVPWLAASGPETLAALDDEDLDDMEPADFFPQFEADPDDYTGEHEATGEDRAF